MPKDGPTLADAYLKTRAKLDVEALRSEFDAFENLPSVSKNHKLGRYEIRVKTCLTKLSVHLRRALSRRFSD